MSPARIVYRSIDEYIDSFPDETRDLLNKIRITIQNAAPEAKEIINYGIPTFTLNGNLVHFAGFKHHIGFYPTPSAIEAFRKELSPYEGARGSVKLPLTKPIPFNLISEIVKYRVNENMKKIGK